MCPLEVVAGIDVGVITGLKQAVLDPSLPLPPVLVLIPSPVWSLCLVPSTNPPLFQKTLPSVLASLRSASPFAHQSVITTTTFQSLPVS